MVYEYGYRSKSLFVEMQDGRYAILPGPAVCRFIAAKEGMLADDRLCYLVAITSDKLCRVYSFHNIHLHIPHDRFCELLTEFIEKSDGLEIGCHESDYEDEKRNAFRDFRRQQTL